MKLEDARYQYIILPDEKLGIQDALTDAITEVAHYSLPSDILHVSILDSYWATGPGNIPLLSAKKMSALFKKRIIAVYLEII